MNIKNKHLLVMEDFIDGDITIHELYLQMRQECYLSEKNINYLINKYSITNPDTLMLLLILVWSFPKSEPLQYQNCNDYIRFLNQLIDEIDNFFSLNFQLIYVNNEQIVYQKENIYFYLNNGENEIEMELLEHLKNATFYCYNCNNEENFTNTIIIPAKSFYIIEKISKG